MSLPSLCLSTHVVLRSSKGFVTIKLVEPIQIGAITIDHISDRVAYSVASAPKDFEVFVRKGEEGIQSGEQRQRQRKCTETECAETETDRYRER